MDTHLTRRTTVERRQVILRRVAAGWAYRQVAEAALHQRAHRGENESPAAAPDGSAAMARPVRSESRTPRAPTTTRRERGLALLKPARVTRVSTPRHPHPAPPGRRRHGLSRGHLCAGLPRLGDSPSLYTTVAPADQRKSGALHPNAAARMGVSLSVSLAGPENALPPYLRFYNPRRPPAKPRPALALDAFPRRRLIMNNLFDIHS